MTRRKKPADKDAQYAKEVAMAFNKTQRPKFAAPSDRITNAQVREIYRTGDGDEPITLRPGALDYKNYSSRGFR